MWKILNKLYLLINNNVKSNINSRSSHLTNLRNWLWIGHWKDQDDEPKEC